MPSEIWHLRVRTSEGEPSRGLRMSWRPSDIDEPSAYEAWPVAAVRFYFDLDALTPTVAPGWTQLDDSRLSLLHQVARLQQQVQALSDERSDEQPVTTQAALHELSATWALERPILVTIERYSDDVVARVQELGVYGEGDTEAEALDDLRANMVDLAEQLEAHPQGSAVADRWRRLVRPLATNAPPR